MARGVPGVFNADHPTAVAADRFLRLVQSAVAAAAVTILGGVFAAGWWTARWKGAR